MHRFDTFTSVEIHFITATTCITCIVRSRHVILPILQSWFVFNYYCMGQHRCYFLMPFTDEKWTIQ